MVDVDRLAQLEQQIQALTERVAALEAAQGQQEHKPPLSTSDTAYLATEIGGAIAGSKDAETLNQFQ